MTIENEVRQNVRRLLLRDVHQDVARLNATIGKKGGAGLTPEMPPIPFTGDPFSLTPGHCIGLIGLNPKWTGIKSDHGSLEFPPLKCCVERLRSGDETALDDYLNLRAQYFRPESRFYYGSYFTRLGMHLGREWFGQLLSEDGPKAEAAKAVFSKYVFKGDLLPWFSSNTKAIDRSKLSAAKIADPALLDYYSLLSSLLRFIRPRWLQFNGLQFTSLIEVVLDTKLKPLELRAGQRVFVGATTLSGKLPETSILVHGFVGSQGGPQSPEAFGAVANAFRNWVGKPEVFSFEADIKRLRQ